MTQRHQIETRLTLYDDLTGILNAMRSFARVELQRVMLRENTQQQALLAVTSALREVAFGLPAQPAVRGQVWLLLGSTRGFCSSFNEDVLRVWREAGGANCPTIVLGERLAALMPDREDIIKLAGAISVFDAAPTLERLLITLPALRWKDGDCAGLTVGWRDETGGRWQRLLPLPEDMLLPPQIPPVTHEPLTRVATGVFEHYLFHTLLAVLLKSIRVENHMRLMQMDSAIQHLERNVEILQRQRNRLRQEEIIEEIELMTNGKTWKNRFVAP